jgi:hypothetical protein
VKTEQAMACLLAEIRSNQEKMDAKVDANQEIMADL